MLILIFLSILFMVLPFVPGRIELSHKKDARPLPIDPDKTMAPFEIGDKFLKWIETLGKDEQIVKIPNPDFREAVNYQDGEMLIATVFSKEMKCPDDFETSARTMVYGDAYIGDYSSIQSLLSTGDMHLGRKTVISNWADCRGGNLICSAGTYLGHSCVCKGNVHLGRDVAFERLFGKSVRTSGEKEPYETEYEEIEGDVISKNSIVIKTGKRVLGSISSKKKVILEERSFVCGSIFSDKGVTIGNNCVIIGNVFCQQDISLGENCTVGTEGHVKSVIAGGKIRIGEKTEIFGQIICTEGRTE